MIYPDGQVHVGQMVYRNLVDRLTLRATWPLHAHAPHHLAHTAQLHATVNGAAGWTRRMTLAPPKRSVATR